VTRAGRGNIPVAFPLCHFETFVTLRPVSVKNRRNPCLTETQLQRYADVMMWAIRTARKNPYRPKDVVLVRYDLAALRLAELLQERLLDARLNPVLRMGRHARQWSVRFSRRRTVTNSSSSRPGRRNSSRACTATMSLLAPDSLTHLRDTDPRRIAATAVARRSLRDILWKREEKGEFGMDPLPPADAEPARQARSPWRSTRARSSATCYLDRPDPVAAWKEIFGRAQALKRRLNGLRVKTLHIESATIDLRITPGARRRWLGVSDTTSRASRSFSPPDWRGTEGVYHARPAFVPQRQLRPRHPTDVPQGARGQGRGRGGDESFARKQLAMDPGAAQVGEFLVHGSAVLAH